MKRVSESLKKIRITFRFLLSNLEKSGTFEPLAVEELRPVDQYIISTLQKLLAESKESYQSYNFSKILTTLQHHLSSELSAFYFDSSKDSLYSDSITSEKRKQIQTVLLYVLQTYSTILNPILPTLIQMCIRDRIRKRVVKLPLLKMHPLFLNWSVVNQMSNK